MANATVSERVESLVHNIEEVKLLLRDQNVPDETREKLKKATAGLLTNLEEPKDVILNYAYQMGAKRMALRVGVDLGIFRIVTEGGGRPISSTELAQTTQADESLLIRILRVLVSMNFITEAGEYQYTANEITKAMASPAMEGAVKICHDYSTMVLHRIHEWYREKGYRAPITSDEGPLQWVFNTKKNYFDLVHDSEESVRAFNDFMVGNRVNRKHWIDWFPVEERLLKGFEDIPGSEHNEDHIFMVDIGGGMGRDVEAMLTKFPQCKDRLILQDLQVTVDSAKGLKPGIRSIGHSFFNPQPIKGARMYFTHFVLHDWPDYDCQRILGRLKDAMTPGYSRLILNESVLPDTECASYFAAGDLNLLALIGGLKRSRKQWKGLVESVGLEVVDIATSPFSGDEEGIIEAFKR